MQFQVELTLEDGGLVILQGATVKYWETFGDPDYIGSLDGLHRAYPKVVKQLIDAGLVRET